MVKRMRSPPAETAGSRLWFSLPQGVVSTLLQQSSMNVGRMVALFMLAGNDPTALEHIIEERLTTKPFWRELMRQARVRRLYFGRLSGHADGERRGLDRISAPFPMLPSDSI